jgi:hypothetical protein
MKRDHGRKTATVGDFVAATFDEAALYSSDPTEVTRLATQAVRHLMRRPHVATRLPSPSAL